MFGATIAADTVARGAPQIFVALGGTTILIRGRRPGEEPAAARPIQPYADYSSHNAWGTDHFGFLYEGDLAAFCDTLRAKGVTFPVELKKGLGGSLLCYMKLPNPAVAIASIRKSRDIAWLRGFRANMAAVDAPEIVAAIDERLAELDETALRVAIGRPLANRFLI